MYSARVKLPAHLSQDDIEKLSEALSDLSDTHIALREENNRKSPWTLSWIIEDEIEIAELLSRVTIKACSDELPDFDLDQNHCAIEKVPERDWLSYSYKQFPPFDVGPFFIYSSHYEGEIAKTQIGLQIDATTAFGSGEHGTTEGCLKSMVELKEMGVCPWNILDMGTGSGILAIAAWKLWKTPVLATDNDEEAIKVTTRHCKSNKVPLSPSDVTCAQGEGFSAPIVKERGPYELITANILAGPLIEMAEEAFSVLDDNGYIVLSGILNEQADSVLSAYEALDLKLTKRFEIGEWSTLVLQKI